MADMDTMVEEQDEELLEQDQQQDDDGGDDEADIEARARAQGWRPESEWDAERAEREGRRKPKTFLSARDFLKQNEESMPILRSQVRKLTDELVATKSKVTDMHQILLDQKKMHQDAARRAYERGKQEAEAAMRRAVEEGDVDAYDRHKAQRDKIIQQEQQAAKEAAQPQQDEQQRQQAAPPKVNPDTERWAAQNDWFFTNPVLNKAMVDAHNAVLAENPDMPQWDSLEQAKEIVARKFPERFNRQPNQQRQQTRGNGTVTTPTGNRPSKSTGSARFESLPKDAQEAYFRQAKMFEAQGTTFTKEEYVREYYGEQ